jgi:hypothetical protein
MPARLRFALLAGGTRFQQWEADCLEQMLAVPGVELALLVLDARPPASPNPWYRKWKALRHLNTLLWEFYRRRYIEAALPSRRYVDLSGRLASTPRMEIEIIRRGKFSEYFTAGDIAKIRDHKVDFMIRFGFNILRGEILTCARYGVWSFHHDDLDKYRGSPPCFWEVYFGDPLTGVTLQRLTDKLDSGIVLRKESFATSLDSYPRNIDHALRFGASWPADLCQRILAGDTTALEGRASESSAPVYRAPTNLEMLRMLWRTSRARPRTA